MNADQIARIKKLREQVLQTPKIYLDRGYWLTESYKETESDPPVWRRAKGLKKVLSNMKIGIENGELIVGRVTSKLRGVAAHIITADVPMGKIVGALPDGRKAGEPLSEGGISPYQGRNISGPVATMRSVAKLDHMKLTHGSVLNMRFNPDFLKDDSKMRKFASILRTFCETGGALVQFNIIDTATLKDAQAHPENTKIYWSGSLPIALILSSLALSYKTTLSQEWNLEKPD